MAASKVKITFVPGDIAFWNRHFLPQYVRIVGKRQQSREDRLSGAPEYYTVQELDGKKRKYAKVADAELKLKNTVQNTSWGVGVFIGI